MPTYLSEHFWLDEKVRSFGPVGIAVWSFILQGPHTNVNLPGLYFLPFHAVVEHLGGPQMAPHHLQEAKDAFTGLVDAGMAIYDPGCRVIRIPKVWKHALTPNLNQIMGWRTNWSKIPDSKIRYDHLASLRLLADRNGSEAAINMFDVKFGGIVQGDPRTYRLHHSWKPGHPVPPGLGRWVSDPALPEHTHSVCVDQERSDRNSLSVSYSLSPGSRTLPEPFENPSEMVLEGFSGPQGPSLSKASSVPPAAELNGGARTHREGFENGSGSVREPFDNGSRRVLEGFSNPSHPPEEDFPTLAVTPETSNATGRRTRTPTPTGRPALSLLTDRGDSGGTGSGVQDPGHAGGPGGPSSSGDGIVPEGTDPSGGRSDVVPKDLPKGPRRRYRHD